MFYNSMFLPISGRFFFFGFLIACLGRGRKENKLVNLWKQILPKQKFFDVFQIYTGKINVYPPPGPKTRWGFQKSVGENCSSRWGKKKMSVGEIKKSRWGIKSAGGGNEKLAGGGNEKLAGGENEKPAGGGK